MPVSIEEFAGRYPVLFHMAEARCWPSIRRHGLLSTSALLDLFEVNGERRRLLESCHRPQCVTVEHPVHGRAVIRDQKPMDDSGLRRALRGGLQPADWYRMLNERVFFWLTRERLDRLLSARAYRSTEHTVLEVDCAGLLRAHAPHVELCPMNSGCTKPFPHPRGPDTFQSLSDYPWESRRRRTEAAVELTVRHSVPGIVEHTIRVTEVRASKRPKALWTRARRTT